MGRRCSIAIDLMNVKLDIMLESDKVVCVNKKRRCMEWDALSLDAAHEEYHMRPCQHLNASHAMRTTPTSHCPLQSKNLRPTTLQD